MSSPYANRSLVLRSAAILTTGAVNSTAFLLNRALNSTVSVDVRFTVGSLTNCTFAFLVSTDDVTYVPLDPGASGTVSWVPTASLNRSITIRAPGWTYLRVSAQGSGTVTSSSATITARWTTR